LQFCCAFAQDLVPYQVQTLKSWNIHKLWGYKDKNFNIVIQSINDAPNLFKNGYAVLEKNNKKGLIDATGKMIIQPIYEICSNVEGDIVELKDSSLVTKDPFYSYISGDKPKQSYFLNIKTNQKAFLNNEVNGNIKSELSGVGGLFITTDYDGVAKSSVHGLKNFNNQVLLPNIYKYIDKSDDDILRVQTKDGLYGFVDNKTWVVPPTYNYLDRFEDGIALVKLNNKWGYINKLGKAVIPIQFDEAHSFRSGFAEADMANEKYIIDRSGKTVLKYPSLKYLSYANENIFIIKDVNDSLYIVDHAGTRVYNRGANEIETFDNQNFILRIGTDVFSLYQNILNTIPLNNVSRIDAYKMGVYWFETTENDGKTSISIFDDKGNFVANKEKFYKFRVHDDLQLLEAYWEVKDESRSQVENYYDHYLYTYLNSTGKAFSDITQ
jgi:hypothetical protein